MIDLIRYFKILFIYLKVGREKLRQFTEDHIQRLTVNNPGGIFTTILTDITNAYTAFWDDISSRSLAKAVQEGMTVAMEESRKALTDYIANAEGLISYTFGKTSATYQEFYPQGVTEYTEGSLAELETSSLRFFNVATNHAGALPPSFVTDFNTLRGNFINNRTAQLGQKGVVASETSDIAGTKLAVCTQLTKNLLTIALQFLGDETKAAVYFDQSILESRSGARDLELEIAPQVVENAISNEDGIGPETELSIHNSGTTLLLLGFCATAEAGPEIPPAVNLNPGETLKTSAAELGFVIGTRMFLNIRNVDNLVSGECQIRIIED